MMLTWVLFVFGVSTCTGEAVWVQSPTNSTDYYCAEVDTGGQPVSPAVAEDAVEDFCAQHEWSNGGVLWFGSGHPFRCPDGAVDWSAES